MNLIIVTRGSFMMRAGRLGYLVPVVLAAIALGGCGFGVLPDPPTWDGLLAPAPGATGQSLESTLEWSGSGDGATYSVFLDTVNPPQAKVAEGPQTSHTESGLSPLTTYYWFVRSTVGETTQNSAVWSFTTGGPANTVYVSAALGSAGGAGTAADPLDTVGAGIALAASGGTGAVFVAEGTYDEQVVLEDGVDLYGGFEAGSWDRDPDAWTALLVNSTGATTVSANASAIVDGFTIRTYPAAGAPTDSYEYAVVSSTGSPVITNNTIVGGATDATGESRTLHFQSSSSPTVRGNTIVGSDLENSAGAIGISIATNFAGTLVLEGNDISAGISTRAAWAILQYGGSIDSSGNTFRVTDGDVSFRSHAVETNGSTGSVTFSGDRFIVDSPGSTSSIRVIDASRGITLVNSTFMVETGAGEIIVLDAAGTNSSTVVNNSFVVNAATNAATAAIINVSDTGWVIANNIFHLTTTGSATMDLVDEMGSSPDVLNNFFYRNGEDLTPLGGTGNVTSTSASYLALEDRAAGDFRLTAGTPAAIAEAGLDAAAYGVTMDHVGVTRSVPYSMGAYER